MTTELRLSSAPNGLSGYKVNVTVGDVAVANISGASYPSSFGLADTQVTANGDTATLKAVDLDNNTRPGDTDVKLATLTLNGRTTGTTQLTITVLQMDDDRGGSMQPTLDSGRVSVGDTSGGSNSTPTATTAVTPTVTGTNTPTPTTTTAGTDTATTTNPKTRTIQPSPASPRTVTSPGETMGGSTTDVDGATDATEATPIPIDTASPSPTPTGSPGQPGFGFVLALAGVAGIGLLARRRAG